MPDIQSQYSAAAHVPLIQSPSLRIPQPVAMPQDIHPLPDSVEPYMVYSFTLEQQTIAHEQARRSNFATREAEHQQRLHQWEMEKARRRKAALRKVAPGFEPEMGTLVPTKVAAPHPPAAVEAKTAVSRGGGGVMDDLVDQLARMDSAYSFRDGGTFSSQQ